MNEIFNFDGVQVRTIVKDGEPWFVLKDVCDVLGLRSPDVRARLHGDVVSNHTVKDSLGRDNSATIINEDGLYDVILESRKPEAKAFRKWITSEVLPSIRKHGAYMTPEALFTALSTPDGMIQILTRLKDEQTARAAAEAKILTDKPKVALYDVAMNAGNNKAVGTVAKMLGYGRNKLFELLREEKILRYNNEPYQSFIDRGYFELRLYPIPHTNGEIENKTQPMVTPKGIDFIHKLLLKKGIVQEVTS
jgi:anti-repressor protein